MSYEGRAIGGAVRVDLDGVADDGSISLLEKDNQLGVENVVGTSSHVVLSGDVNANVLTGGPGQDALHGRGGNDSLRGDGGDDKLYGYEANDALIGGAGHDLLDGGVGNDSLVVKDGSILKDTANGGSGSDTCTSDPRDARISCER